MSPVTYDLNFSHEQLSRIKGLVKDIVDDDIKFPKKIRSDNFYKKLSNELKLEVDSILRNHGGFSHLNWYYEIFFSRQAVGMHNDRNFFPANKELCERGFIIPIEWSGKTPETRFYDLFIDKKVNWDGKGFATLEKVPIDYDKEALKRFEPVAWQKNSILFFDGRQIHDASEFKLAPDDYKLSINGLGYSVQ